MDLLGFMYWHQVLRQLAKEVSYRSLAALGIASIQGTSVASFDKQDAERFLFFCTEQETDKKLIESLPCIVPCWFNLPVPSRKRSGPFGETKTLSVNGCTGQALGMELKGTKSLEERQTPSTLIKQKVKVASMRPVPRTRQRKMLPFCGVPEVETDANQVKNNLSIIPAVKHTVVPSTSVSHRKSMSSSYQAQQIISLNPLPLKKHGCGRCPIQACSEVSQFFYIGFFFF